MLKKNNNGVWACPISAATAFLVVMCVAIPSANGETPALQSSSTTISGNDSTKSSLTPAPSHWVIYVGSLALVDSNGMTKLSESIKAEVHQSLLPPEKSPDMKPLSYGHWVTCKASGDGKFALVIEHNKDIETSTTVAKFYDSNGVVIWKRDFVAGNHDIEMSSDGGVTLLVVTNNLGCASQADPDCFDTAEAIDFRGNEIMRFGPFKEIDQIGLTKNGRYGFAYLFDDKRDVYMYQFFDLTTQRIVEVRLGDAEGLPIISENGIVQFIVNEYANSDSDKAPQIIKSRATKTFKIE